MHMLRKLLRKLHFSFMLISLILFKINFNWDLEKVVPRACYGTVGNITLINQPFNYGIQLVVLICNNQ